MIESAPAYNETETIPETLEVTEANLMDVIQNAPPLATPTESPAPFKDFAENTNKEWVHVPSEEAEAYLQSKLFFDPGTIKYEDKTPSFEISRSNEDETIKIPLDLVVYAQGFKDWTGRPAGNDKGWQSRFGYGSMKSQNVIKHYASLPTEIPEISSMYMYVQPDKKIFFDNGAGDSHRIAAAILRGQKDIETRHLWVYKLSRNYL